MNLKKIKGFLNVWIERRWIHSQVWPQKGLNPPEEVQLRSINVTQINFKSDQLNLLHIKQGIKGRRQTFQILPVLLLFICILYFLKTIRQRGDSALFRTQWFMEFMYQKYQDLWMTHVISKYQWHLAASGLSATAHQSHFHHSQSIGSTTRPPWHMHTHVLCSAECTEEKAVSALNLSALPFSSVGLIQSPSSKCLECTGLPW